MVTADLTRAMLLGVLSITVALNWLPIGGLVAVVFLIACAGCFFDPAAQAGIPVLAGRNQATLAKANGWLWAFDILGRSLLGPPIGAVLFASAAVLPFALNWVTFLVSAALLAGLVGLGRAEHADAGHTVKHAVAEGVRYLTGHGVLRLLTIGMATYNLGYNVAFATLVLFSQDRLDLSSQGFGILLAMLAVGGIVGGWLGPQVHVRLSIASTYAVCLGLQGVCWLAAVTSDNVWITGAVLVVVGLASTVVSVVGGTARQTLTPDHLLGRISAGTRVVGIGAAAIGSLIGGGLASIGTLGTPLAVAGLFLLVGAAAFAIPAVMHRT